MSDEAWVFVIDTEQYAGNFERQLTAFSTGNIGGCEVGNAEAGQFADDLGEDAVFENIERRPDDTGCFRPTSIWPTPGWFNHGMGGHFREGDDEAASKHYDEAVTKESNRHPYQSDEANSEHRQRWISKVGNFGNHPAYLSVAIFFGTKPTAEQISIMRERSYAFASSHSITITGFRLLHEVTTRREIDV